VRACGSSRQLPFMDGGRAIDASGSRNYSSSVLPRSLPQSSCGILAAYGVDALQRMPDPRRAGSQCQEAIVAVDAHALVHEPLS